MSNGRILIVVDDRDQLAGMAALLRGQGYDVLGAADGMTAIREAAKESPDLILLDLGLPAGDGFWVLKRLKSTWRMSEIPVIVLTAREAKPAREQAYAAGAEGFGVKPVDSETLLMSIRGLLDGPRREAAAAIE